MIVKKAAISGAKVNVSISQFFSERLKQFDVMKAIKALIEERENQIADLNTAQLEKGEDSEGNDLGVYKVFSYKNRFRPVDLRDTGAFHNSINPDVKKDQFIMSATDEKTDMLQDKYGDEILGLNDDSKQYVIDDIRDDLINESRKAILK